MAAVVSSMPVHLQHGQIEGTRVRSFSRTSSVRSMDSGRSLREIEEVPSTPGSANTPDVTLDTSREVEEMEEKVYIAVGKEVKESKSTLVWALQNISRDKKVVLVHVHRPAQMIPMMGGKFPASQLTTQLVKAHRRLEKGKLNKTLDEYLLVCASAKVQAEKLVIEMDDIAKGLVELIAKHGISKLVMGAAADKHYSKKMKVPKSKTSSAVQKEAFPSCNIWFVCKGNLICTREASLDGYQTTQSSMSSPSPSTGSTETESLRSRSLSQGNQLTNSKQHLFRHRSIYDNYALHGDIIMEASPHVGVVRMSTLPSMITTQETNLWGGILRRDQGSNRSLSSASDEFHSNLSFGSMPKHEESEDGSVILPGPHEFGEDVLMPTPHDKLEDVSIESDIYDQLQEALMEAQSLRHEAYEESCRRRKAERDALEAIRKAKASERLYAKEVKQRKEIEETVAEVKLELEMLKIQRDELFEELKKTDEQKSALEIQLVDSDRVVRDFEGKLSAVQHRLSILQKEKDDLQQEVNSAVREAEELPKNKDEVTVGTHTVPNFSEFSYMEIEQATQGFDNLLKIGEGGFGIVYKGFLRHTTVAIKRLHPESIQGRSEFHQEVAVLSKVRHPNLVTLIGACSEAWSLIYEYLPNGSLEDRLVCKDNTTPLSWQLRTRIASEICSALIFLHSNKPHSIVHGDLKPDNILLDANFVTKLGDFGISRLLVQSNTTTTLYRRTHPKGTFVYIDPQFLATGELTPRSDIYSFGIIVLRLLTGRPALGIVKEVQGALDKGKLHTILDPSAGDWPFVQAQQVAHLALRCCEINRKSRPDLVGEVQRILEPLKAASLGPSLPSASVAEDNNRIPSYFICPIFQEVMRDPHVAADGFTYEAEALKGWLESGHGTSPMTNLKLAQCNLIPNRALRSAIQEWLQQHRT